MTASVTLLMAIHCHQPVGNFEFVFERAFDQAYDPFVQVLERHPSVRLALHYSGCLLDWLAARRPAFLNRIRALVARGQVELLASGYYEPILPMIPESDRQGQIAQMRRELRTRFKTEADGLWLTERVWEPDLPATLARAGIRYTMVDVNQFASTRPWVSAARQVQDDAFWDLLGSYTTDYAGSTVRLFPASKRLRYWMPFQRVEQTIEWLRRLQRHEPVAVTFADDGEKFGLWPKTHHWVYEEGWLEQLCSAIERERGWLATETFRDYAAATPPDGRVALPGGSYEEMLEWSGGHFRNFFTKYPEANAMQQKMLRLSREISELQASGHKLQASSRKPPAAGSLQPAATRRQKLLQRAQEALYAGQCNCAYWHGVFGGLYLAHLRRAVYDRLIAAESLAHQAAGRAAAVTAVDADGDGREEAQLTTPSMSLVVDPDDGGTITEWSLSGARLNLLDTLTRRYEPYHEKLKAKAEQAAAVAGGPTPASIHDLVGAKEANLSAHLAYDDHRRSAFHDYGFQQRPSLQEVVRSTWGERRLWAGGACAWQRGPAPRASAQDALRVVLTRPLAEGRVRKTVRAWLKRPVVECRYDVEGFIAPVIGLEFNLSLRDERYLTSAQQVDGATAFRLQEAGAGVSLEVSIDPPATLVHFPVETVSESEEGLERTYQGLCLVCFWELPAPQGRPNAWTATLTWTVG